VTISINKIRVYNSVIILDMSDDDDTLYCICQQPAGDEFMIQCDHCTEWFHGDCVDEEEQNAEYIVNYFCPTCRQTDPRKFRIRDMLEKNDETKKVGK